MRRALAFLTPIGGAAPPSAAALPWFPVIGAGIGLALSGIWWLASEIWTAPIAAAVVVAADLALTGMLHFDGLVDSGDGLLPPLDPERRLQVMSEPAAGAFGIGAGVSVVLLRWAAIAALAPSLLLLPALWCASRTVMAFVTRSVPYARPGGLAESFRGREPRRAVALSVGGVGVALGLAVVAAGLSGAAAVVAVLLGGGAVVVLAARRIGGFTGDVLGAAGMVGETAGLLAAAARW